MDGLIQLVRNLGTTRMIILLGVTGVTISIFFSIIGQIGTGDMATLFSSLENEDRIAIQQKLIASGVNFEVEGDTIKVPRNQVDEMRIKLAEEGLTGGVIVGMEIFDRESSFARTSLELNVNRVRAIEGELARTIRSIQGVNDARVHVVMPEQRAFSAVAQQASASIILKSRGSISGQQALAIQALVATAVPGLSPDRVTIADASGQLLVDGANNKALGGITNLEEARIAKQNMYRTKVENILSRVVGGGRVRAEIALEMTMSRVTTSQVTFDPDAQVVASSSVQEESNSDLQQVGGDVSLSTQQPDGSGNAGSTGSQGSKTSETTNFDNSKTETVTVREPGEVTRLRVAVLIDHNRPLDENGQPGAPVPWDQDSMDNFENLVRDAIPFQEDRDSLTVAQMAFADAPEILEEDIPFEFMGLDKQTLVTIVQYLTLGLVGILFVLMILRPLVTRIVESIPDAPPPVDPNAITDQTPGAVNPAALLASGDKAGLTPELLAAAASGDENATSALMTAREKGLINDEDLRIDAQIDIAQVEGRIQDSAMKKVADIIRTNPDETVAIVRSWLYAD